MILDSFPQLFSQALARRSKLIKTLESEKTNTYRLFHGVSEGIPGLTIDRYHCLLLIQTFRAPLTSQELSFVRERLQTHFPSTFAVVYNHRGKSPTESFEKWHRPEPHTLEEIQCEEFGLSFLIRARHSGNDPWLFLDLRAGRRYFQEIIKGRSFLNLFSYTCSVGVCAAAWGASEVWNVDFSASHLEIGKKNAVLNQVSQDRFFTLHGDCLPVMRQLAGLPVGGRKSRKGRPSPTQKQVPLEPRLFDFVFLDPPAWSKGAFGAVDVVRDYPSLFKAALLCTQPTGGQILATHHVASVSIEDWVDILKRCAVKAGRPIRSLQILHPDEDFPSFDGRPPLKIAVCEV